MAFHVAIKMFICLLFDPGGSFDRNDFWDVFLGKESAKYSCMICFRSDCIRIKLCLIVYNFNVCWSKCIHEIILPAIVRLVFFSKMSMQMLSHMICVCSPMSITVEFC